MKNSSPFRLKLVIILLILLIGLNLTSLYFIYDLYTYDEIIAYLPDNSIKSNSPRSLAFTLYITALVNVLYAGIGLMSRLISPPG